MMPVVDAQQKSGPFIFSLISLGRPSVEVRSALSMQAKFMKILSFEGATFGEKEPLQL